MGGGSLIIHSHPNIFEIDLVYIELVIKNMVSFSDFSEISFLGSLEDSIFYSIARFFLSDSNTVLPLYRSA